MPIKIFLFIFTLVLNVAPCHAETIKIPISEQIQSFMDERHYNPTEIDQLSLPPNKNREATFYIDGENGNDAWNGSSPTHTTRDYGPFKTISRASGRYDGHKQGERVLIKAGYYREGFGSGNLTGFADDLHYNTWGPYGDGEVIIDLSQTPGLDPFTVFDGTVWKAKVNEKWPGFPTSSVSWAVMDWNHRSCREAIGYKGKDNGSGKKRNTSLVDSTKDFTQYKKEHGSGPTDFIGAYVWNITDGSWGIVTSVSTTKKKNDTLNVKSLTGGKTNQFNPGDSYAVYQLNQDGRFANVENTFYIFSTKGEPRSRNLLANKGDWDNAVVPIYAEGQNFHFYGLTFVGAPSIGVMTVGGNQNVIFEKCRFLFTGKHATSVFGDNTQSIKWIKNFFYANVMMNWPRGNTWGGNGGWPNNLGGGGRGETETIIDGNIIISGGGEGMNTATAMVNNIVVDSYSMNIYTGDGPVIDAGYEISNNDVIFTGYKPDDALERFYLDESYNGYQRNYVKMHPNGITIASERSGGGNTPKNFRIKNNNIIGCWNGISSYFEVPTAGFQDSVIENNTIITMTSQDTPPALFTDSAGIQLKARKGVDYGTTVRNNRIIGANNTDKRHHLILIYGKDYSTLTVDQNVYSFPGNDSFMTDKGKKSFDQWKKLTGYDKNSVFTDDPGLVGKDWTDSSRIFKPHLSVKN
ncbi:MAG: hypothetical protein KBD53_02935 [Candidatus Omnitrophica bacterium]|nr:hypothetical protein [Candidatus Omnitrophota bacterium]